jgi:hypothetical protein
MAALKESMGRAKLRDPVRRRIGKPEKGSGKAASVAPEANLAPGRRQVGATHRGNRDRGVEQNGQETSSSAYLSGGAGCVTTAA